MSLRSNNVSGLITGVFGVAMVAFATFGLLIVALQRVVISEDSDKADPSLLAGMNAIHDVLLVYLPLMIVGGVVFAAAGYCVYRGSNFARRVAQVNALCGYVWIIAYSMSCYRILPLIMPPSQLLSQPAGNAFTSTTMALSCVMLGVFPTALLFILSRPRNRLLPGC